MRNILIDTDAGIDDSAAILLALRNERNDHSFIIRAVTVVAGNTSIESGIENVKILSKLCKSKCLVYKGCSLPLVQHRIPTSWPGHGCDGLGGFTNSSEFKDFKNHYINQLENENVQEQHASLAMIEMAKKFQELGNPLNILALGPLTNIALAISLDPLFLSRIDRLVVMGGTLNARGNSGKSSEFNFHYDPYAAHIVFSSSSVYSGRKGKPCIELITWDTCLDHAFPWSTLTKFQNRKPFGYLINKICQKYQDQVNLPINPTTITHSSFIPKNDIEKYKLLLNQLCLCDIYAAFAMLYPETIQKSINWNTDIELDGAHTKGSNLFDWMLQESGNCNVILEFKQDLLVELFSRLLLSEP